MRIKFVDIRNFRKLESCRVDLATKQTIFVGANNSGKTSAMDALILFLKTTRRKDICTTDFTLSNWKHLNAIGVAWTENTDPSLLDLRLDSWRPYVPTLDVWLEANDDHLHYVSHLLPSLEWDGGLLGVRLAFEPKKIEDLFKGFVAASQARRATLAAHNKELALWPHSMQEFLDKELHTYFSIFAYLLDPSKAFEDAPQLLPPSSERLEGDPLEGLFKVDIINAQRGFSDPSTGDGETSAGNRLSSQLRHYFEKHLNPTDLPDVSDLEALEAIETAREAFDKRLEASFKPALGELSGLNYPGFSDPKIRLSTKVAPLEGLAHDSAVQFFVGGDEAGGNALRLPEKYNGLGYQNLISMVFRLIRYRDEWMRQGKAGKRTGADVFIEPLHLVLIEEPEAHLHAQVQQVFIKRAYQVLRNHNNLGAREDFSTQMVVSTHSSHIAHEIDFSSLRYFQRSPLTATQIPRAAVVNLTTTFGDNTETSKFATRYLRTTHCDLFFADAAILVEGPAERMLVPHFIRTKFPELDQSYISLLEIGGSHAHRLKPLVEKLGLPTLVITDVDTIGASDRKKVPPKRGFGLRTNNDTLKSWVPCIESLDKLLDIEETKKATATSVRVAYQHATQVEYTDGAAEEAIPYTFEDALALANVEFFKSLSIEYGLGKKMRHAVSKPTLQEACEAMFNALEKGDKAELALELLYLCEPSELNPPLYITEGLEWLKEELAARSPNLIVPKGEGEVARV